MTKGRFRGKYYKHQTKDGYTLAIINSYSNEGHMVQIITNEKSFLVADISQIEISDAGINFNINQGDLKLTGHIGYMNLIKPKKDIMSYYRFLPIECKHRIFSFHQNLSGSIKLNGNKKSFDDGDGYIEGDKGRNFPTKYVWLNSSNDELAITSAIASIPLGLFTITGNTTSILHNGKEYRFGTYNASKVKKISKDEIIITKGKYTLTITIIDENKLHPLKAPVKGDMVRYIHECPSLKTKISLKKNHTLIFDVVCPYTSFEYVWDE